MIGTDLAAGKRQRYLARKRKRAAGALPKSLQKTVEVSMSFGDKGDSPFMPEYEAAPPKKEQQSFWGKYWWMILIGGFVLLQSMAAGAGAA